MSKKDINKEFDYDYDFDNAPEVNGGESNVIDINKYSNAETDSYTVDFYSPIEEWLEYVKTKSIRTTGHKLLVKRLPPKIGSKHAFTPNMDPYTVTQQKIHKAVVVGKGPDVDEKVPGIEIGDIVCYENYHIKEVTVEEPMDLVKKPFQEGVNAEVCSLDSYAVDMILGKYDYDEWKDGNGVIFTEGANHSKVGPPK